MWIIDCNINKTNLPSLCTQARKHTVASALSCREMKPRMGWYAHAVQACVGCTSTHAGDACVPGSGAGGGSHRVAPHIVKGLRMRECAPSRTLWARRDVYSPP